MHHFLWFDLFFSRPVELHAAGWQEKHGGTAGGLPCGSHPEDLQIPTAAQGECWKLQPHVVELPHPHATSAGHWFTPGATQSLLELAGLHMCLPFPR